MSEVKPPSKGKNKKKKTKANLPAEASPSADVESMCSSSLKLPQNVSESTFINEVQVTLTDKKEEAAQGKKNKGSKKSAKEVKSPQSKWDAFDTSNNASPADNEPPLLSFSRGGSVELKHLPEITVTRTNESKTASQSVNNIPEEPVVNDSSGTATTAKKKKKKKKKNKSTSQEDNTETNEIATSQPTYVKLPATGDACVLVVSHESFSGNDASKKDANRSSAVENYSPRTETNQLQSTKLTSCPKNSFTSSEVTMTPSIKKSDTLLELVEARSVSIIPIKSDDTSQISSCNENDSVIALESSGVEGNRADVENQFQKSTEAEVVPNLRIKSQTDKLNKVTKSSKKSDSEDPIKPLKKTPDSEECIKPSKKSPDSEDSFKPSKKSDSQEPIKLSKKSPDSQESMKPSKKSDSQRPIKSSLSEKANKVKASVKERKTNQVGLFAHLPQYKTHSLLSKHLEFKSDIHPAVIAVGAQCAEGIISGSNARCVAVLAALTEVIKDYVTPPNKELSRDLEAKFQVCINFISKCRPLSVSISNAVRVIKHCITNIPHDVADDDAKSVLYSQISKFIKEEICLARKAIACNVGDRIADGDVILTYAYSSVIKHALCAAHEAKKSFKVIVVDSRPKMEGRQLLKCLLKAGIKCSYVLINGISYVMQEVTKVIIGAHGLQANGYVMSHVGSSQIALVCSLYRVPFLVCCETYKFCERSHTDSFVFNELGDPESFLKYDNADNCILKNWREMGKLQLLNLLYDITPPHLVSTIITEKGLVACTSVPVILRARHTGRYN